MQVSNRKIDMAKQEFSIFLQELLDDNISVNLTVTGDSMFPLWRHKRDSVVLTKCDKNTLKKGDIPLYKRRNGQYVIHRIVKVNKNGYYLCGDAQAEIEYNVPSESIVAVVTSFTRKDKKYDCDDWRVRLYAFLWMRLFPIRGLILMVFSIIRVCKSKIHPGAI